jgi:choline dehydrogenase
MATRLAENGTYTVAVVEAGGFYELENGNLTIVPGYYNQNLGHPSVDWNFKTTPQAGLQNQTFDYARGKTLGGRYARPRIDLPGEETDKTATAPL